MSQQGLLPLSEESRKEVLQSNRVANQALNVELLCVELLNSLNQALALVLTEQPAAKVCHTLEQADLEQSLVLDCVLKCR